MRFVAISKVELVMLSVPCRSDHLIRWAQTQPKPMPEIDAVNHAPRLYTTPEGHLLRMRNVGPGDSHLLAEFIERVSYGGRYFRFGHGDYHMSELDAARMCQADTAAEAHFVVVEADAETEILAHAECYLDTVDASCEFGILVADAWCGLGIGRWLMAEVIEHARVRGAKHVVAKTLMTNSAMIKLARNIGFSVSPAPSASGICLLSYPLGDVDTPCVV